jgi:multidrug resistance efflux pump
MDQHSPIPIPREHAWREFRIKRIPLIFFSIALAMVVFIWKDQAAAPAITGEVEIVSADVISTLPGMLMELNVDRFERVAKNQVIGRVFPSDPEMLKTSLAAVEIELKMLRAQMGLDRARNEMDYEKLRLDYLNQRVELATARTYLEFAENEFQRHASLLADKLVSVSLYEETKSVRDARKMEVSEKEKVLAELEKRLATMVVPQADPDDPLSTAIAAEEAKILLVEGPITLKSPIDGIVSDIAFQAGERVMAGVPIVTISSTDATRIIGFVRQPITKVPKVGDSVQVRKRGLAGQTATAKVLRVGSDLQWVLRAGSDLQAITSPMRSRGYDPSMERGLPFIINLPAELEVHPGELVDLRLQQ